MAFDDEKSSTVPQDVYTDDNVQSDRDGDDAAAFAGDHATAIDPVMEARVLWKIDWYLIPAMSIGYGLVYYDKVCHSFKMKITSI